mgnify:FL=1
MSTKNAVTSAAHKYIDSAFSRLALLPGPLPEKALRRLLKRVHIQVSKNFTQARLTASIDEIREALNIDGYESTAKEQQETQNLFHEWTSIDLGAFHPGYSLPQLLATQQERTSSLREGIPKDQPWLLQRDDFRWLTRVLGHVPTPSLSYFQRDLVDPVFAALGAGQLTVSDQDEMVKQSREVFAEFWKQWETLLRAVASHATADQPELQLDFADQQTTNDASSTPGNDGDPPLSGGVSPSPSDQTGGLPPELLAIFSEEPGPEPDADTEFEF